MVQAKHVKITQFIFDAQSCVYTDHFSLNNNSRQMSDTAFNRKFSIWVMVTSTLTVTPQGVQDDYFKFVMNIFQNNLASPSQILILKHRFL